MTEFEQRLTHEYSKLAEQYAQEQTQLSAPVASLGKQVRQLAGQYAQGQTRLAGQVVSVVSLEEHVRRLAEQYAQEQKAHIEWASTLAEHVGKLTPNYKALTDDLTEFFR